MTPDLTLNVNSQGPGNLGPEPVPPAGIPVPREKKKGTGPKNEGVADGAFRDTEPRSAGIPPEFLRSKPTITWTAPGPITYGDALSTSQLNATASVMGTFVYTPGPGYVLPAGTHTIWVTFTPADLDSYASLQTGVSISVAKAIPAISWPTPTGIAKGVALDETQLNASTSVPGTFHYSSVPGERLSPGTHTLSVTFTPADSENYATAQATVSLKVWEHPVIEWPNPQPITYGTLLSSSQLCATSPVQGTFEYNPALGALLAAGEHCLSLTFTPADGQNYSRARAMAPLSVAKASPAISWQAPDPIAYGAALSSMQLNVRSTVPGRFAYTPPEGEILAPGVHTLSVTFTPTDTLNYLTARANVSLTVTETFPTLIDWPIPSAIPYGAALGPEQLNAIASVPGTFSYIPAAGHILVPGRHILSVSFTPTETKKYATAHSTVTLDVEGFAEISASSATLPESKSIRTGTEPDAAPAASVAAELPDAVTPTKLTETRIYKGAVYEKGEDNQWHLRQE